MNASNSGGASRMAGLAFVLAALCLAWTPALAQEAPPLSEATENCLACHGDATPGIVGDWRNSRHARTSYALAAAKPEAQRRVSPQAPPEDVRSVAVGCAECHTLNPASHKDSFDHEGAEVHVVVSPPDCAVCHSVQAGQYGKNKMAHAHGNLMGNPLYVEMVDAINGVSAFDGKGLAPAPADPSTNADSCLACHGTRVEVQGLKTRETDFGELEFPVLTGWPSQGVGRVNPDGSLGACTACHPRHGFNIKTARQPYTCSQCHKGPDAPAYSVYSVSKHGNIFQSEGKNWNFDAAPWIVGRDFTAPTCAACHISGVVDENGNTLAVSTHQMNDRLPWRLFGVVYSHPQPKSPDTSIIRNKEGQPLPASFDGTLAADFLIDGKTREERARAMQGVCAGCHSSQWMAGHWERFEHTLQTTDAMVKASTAIMVQAWGQGYAQGPAKGKSPFDEPIERKWMGQWLFYANSTRKASAMAGADYGVFAGGRWDLSGGLAEMAQWLDQQKKDHPRR